MKCTWFHVSPLILGVVGVIVFSISLTACSSSEDTHVTPTELNAQWAAEINNDSQKVADNEGTDVSISDAVCTITDVDKGHAICKASFKITSGYTTQNQSFYWSVTYDVASGSIKTYNPRNG